jgi:polyisoprenoid-binding protein YceI
VKHPIRWLLGGFAVVLVAAVALGAWYVFGDSAPPKPRLSATAPVDSGGPATPDGTWKIVRGENVYVGYRMTEVFAGDLVHKEAVGRTPVVDGSTSIKGNMVTAAIVTADLRELRSNRSPRDNYIHAHAIESDTFPMATFELTKPLVLPTPLRKGVKLERLTATGALTLHGVTRTITVPLDARWDGSKIEVAGNAPVVLADYKIVSPDTGVVKVDDHGSLDLSLVFQHQ